MARQEYHIAVKVDSETIHIAWLIGKRHDLAITELTFKAVNSESRTYPVYVYWKGELPRDDARRAKIERAVLDYCGRLFYEAAYEGSIDCCL